MSRPVVSILSVLAITLVPATALANEFTDTTLFVGEDNAEINLSATAALSEPRVRTSAGEIKIWFSDMSGSRMSRDGDGEIIRDIEIRGAAGDSMLVTIKLTDSRVVPAELVSIERGTGGARVRIPRAALPGAVADLIAAESEVPAASPPPESAEDAAPTPTDEAAAPAVEEEAEGTPLPYSSTARRNRALPQSGAAGVDVGVLVLITLLLGVVFLGTKFLRKRKPPAIDEIQVVSTKRLGTRHQLVIVRALGEDHLLSIQGSQTTKIASLPTPEGLGMEPAAMAMASEPEPPPSFLKPANVLARIGDSLGLSANRNNAATETISLPTAVTAPPRTASEKFGAQLLNLAAARRDRVKPEISHESEAVAGLVKLRHAVGQR